MKLSNLKSGMRVTLRVKEGNNEDEVYYIVRDMVVGLHLKDKASLFNPYDSRVVAHISGYTDEFNHKETPLLDIMEIYDIDDTLLFERDADWTKAEIGEDVEYFENNKWNDAKFVFYDKANGNIKIVTKKGIIYNRTSETVRLKSKKSKTSFIDKKESKPLPLRKTDRYPTVLFPIKGSKDEIVSFRVEDEAIINRLQGLLQSEGTLEHSRF
ncbi:MAG: hypothetical protein UCP83_18800 [Intestinibacter bartlettii]|nr:hypothetical protein [Intestinibacter bartlettii]